MSWRVETSLQVPVAAPASSTKATSAPLDKISDAHQKVTRVAQSVTQKSQHESNGDYREIPDREPLYLGIDGVGGARQVWEIAINAMSIAQAAGGPVAAVATATVGVCLVSALFTLALGVGGVGNTYIALRWWLQDAKDTLKGDKEKLALLDAFEAILELSSDELNTLESQVKELPDVQKALECLKKMRGENIDSATLAKMKEEAAEAIKIAALSVKSHYLYAVMGMGQTGLATVSMLSDVGAKAFHYTPVLTGTVGTVAGAVGSMVLGGIYLWRGKVMHQRAKKSYTLVKDFRREFNQLKNINEAMGFLQKAEKRDVLDGNLTRRVNAACLTTPRGTYTAHGFLSKDERLIPYENDTQRVEYLSRVDKGIFTNELKQETALKISKAMMFGGALALIAGIIAIGLLFSNPAGIVMALLIAIAAIGLISAVFFCGVEYIFLVNDSSKLFTIYRDYKYKPAENAWLFQREKFKPLEEPVADPNLDACVNALIKELDDEIPA